MDKISEEVQKYETEEKRFKQGKDYGKRRQNSIFNSGKARRKELQNTKELR